MVPDSPDTCVNVLEKNNELRNLLCCPALGDRYRCVDTETPREATGQFFPPGEEVDLTRARHYGSPWVAMENALFGPAG